MARFETIDDIAESMRITAIYWDKNGVENRATLLRRWADELDPPTIKCTYSGCNWDALFRVELPSHDGEPARVSFQCADHVAVRMSCNAPFGTIKVDLV